MRLLFGLLGAVACHGLVFGVALALLPHQAAPAAAVAALDVEVVPAPPDPVAPPPVSGQPAQPARPAHHVRARTQPAAAPRLDPAPAPPSAPSVSQGASAPAAAAPAVSTGVAQVQAPVPAATAVLSAQPRYRSNPVPYPSAARRLRQEGVVLVRVVVGADGLPTAVSIERSCGHPLLDDAALDAVRRWTFEPARAAGTPVVSLLSVPVRFSLSDAR